MMGARKVDRLGEGKGRGEPDLVLGEGKRLRTSRKNGNRQPQEIGGWEEPTPECTRDLGGERLSRNKGRNPR